VRSGYRFDRRFRLPDESAFARVFAKANRSRDNLFTVLSRENGKDYARLGLAISKKHCRQASGRNRLKRLVRESFRHHKAELAGLDLVVLGQPGASRADNQTVFASLARHWQKTRSANRSVPANEGQQVEKRHGNESGPGKPG
jgi:ribonuclease P protein component